MNANRAIRQANAEKRRVEFLEKVQRGETAHSPVRILALEERQAYEAELLAREAKRSAPVGTSARPSTAHLLRPPARYRSPPPPLSAEERAEAFTATRCSVPAAGPRASSRTPRAPVAPPAPAPPAPPAGSGAACAPAPDLPEAAAPAGEPAPVPRPKRRRTRAPRATSTEKVSAALPVVEAELRAVGKAVRALHVALVRDIPLPVVNSALVELVKQGRAKAGRQGTYLAVRRGRR